MAKHHKLTEEQLNSLKTNIMDLYKIPQLLTDSVTAGFVLDLLDIFSTDENWLKLDRPTKLKKVTSMLESLEASNHLASKVQVVKERFFADDEETPKLPKRNRVFYRVR